MDVALRSTHRKDAVSFECEGQLTNVETEFGTSSSSDSKQIFNVLSHTTTPDAVAQDATTTPVDHLNYCTATEPGRHRDSESV